MWEGVVALLSQLCDVYGAFYYQDVIPGGVEIKVLRRSFTTGALNKKSLMTNIEFLILFTSAP